GDIVLVRATKPYASKKESKPLHPTYQGRLEQTPKVEAALVSIDPQTREVRALVGGYGLGAGTFNRAVQAKRQPGSTFKPFVYASAFATEKYTPLSICLDAPRVYRDPWTGRSWKPQNYGGKFSGEITLRKALTLSKNLCSVALIDKVGVEPVLDMAKRAGISTALPRNLTLALGSGDVTPLEMVNAYATLAAGGQVAAPIFVRKVVAPDGEVLYETESETKQTIRPEVVYLTTSLMQSVVEDGTAKRVKQLERPVAGKTGTTNESRNAWFIGFTPDHVAGVWVGFDNNDPLGPYETGGRAAIPVWLDYMTEAMRDRPAQEFVPPANVVFALVDPKTGQLAPPDFEGALNEPFIQGTEPTEFMPNELSPEQLEFHDEEFR
ncbi:MAG: penicillin-binding transpeptidase domain-containing protein, partial [Myxococcota bacterium]